MRLSDLHCNWALQYARESSQYDPRFYAEIPDRLHQLDGYLMGTQMAVLACGRRAGDWAEQPHPWDALGEMLARYEAEFPGRLIHGPVDVDRMHSEPADGLCWGVLAVEGFDVMVREAGDLDRLATLLNRGVRVFQLVETGASLLGGSAADDESRGLSELGRLFLDRLSGLAPVAGQTGPRPAVDLSDLNARTTADVLDWFEADADHRDRLLLIRSHGSIDHPGAAEGTGLTAPDLDRLRALGGMVGLSCGREHFASPDALRAAIEVIASRPFLGREGYEGIGIGTDFLNVERPLEGMENVENIVGWLEHSFGPEEATRLGSANARDFILGTAGVTRPQNHPAAG